jgi:catechol 2,3-dioxygenase-like lactoylglutathione lyase family enzyme
MGESRQAAAMKLGYTILYVDDVEKTVAFYESAFGLERNMVQPGEFGELATGATKLAFAAKSHVTSLLPIPVQPSGPQHPAPPVEIGLVTQDVQAAFDKASAAGAVVVTKPAQKPWGQIVAYVRDNNGFLVELCTPMD